MTGETFPALPTPPFPDRIRQDTAGAHGRVVRIFRILDPRLTLATYMGWLERLHGLYLPREAQVDPWGDRLMIDWPARRKTPLLCRDVLIREVTPERIEGLPVPAGRTTTVPDMSAVGGHLAATSGLPTAKGPALFVPPGAWWLTCRQSLRERLAAAAIRPEPEQRMIASARAAFGHWLGWA